MVRVRVVSESSCVTRGTGDKRWEMGIRLGRELGCYKIDVFGVVYSGDFEGGGGGERVGANDFPLTHAVSVVSR